MNNRYLFGPVSREFAEQNLYQERQAGHCLAFDSSGTNDLTIGPDDSWESVTNRLPVGWRPDFIALQIYYASIPACLLSAPVPVIVLAGDANLLWHYYRLQLPVADFILTDTTTCERLARAGIQHAAGANLFGCERVMLESGQQQSGRRPVGTGSPDPVPCSTEGLPIITAEETFGRDGGRVGRPAHNAGAGHNAGDRDAA